MPSIVVNATATLNALGTSLGFGTISWTEPSLPAEATLTSKHVSGSWTWSGSGRITRVTINGVDTSDGVAFNVDITNATILPSGLSMTCVGNNRNARGNNFTWSNLVVTYEYTMPITETLYFKNNGSWVSASKAYKKINGVWVEQTDLTSVFDSSTNYVKG